MIVFNSYLPFSLVVVFAIIAVIAAIAMIFLNWKSGIARSLVLASLVLLIANPQIQRADQTPLDDIVLVLVDRSQSHLLGERNAIADKAVEKLKRDLEALDNTQIEIIEYAGDFETRSFEAINNAIASAPRSRLAGVFVVTDGQTNDRPATAVFAGLEAPVHLILTGAADERDRKITLTNAPRYGLVGQSVRVSFQVDDFGRNGIVQNTDSIAPNVTLRINGEELISQSVALGAQTFFDVPLNQTGKVVVELDVDGLNGELTDKNNIEVLTISAIRDRLRVLLISGEPHPGERVWRNLLKSDPAVDLVHFTILRPIEKNDNTPVTDLALIPFPEDELFIDTLSEFDLIIFDRYTYRRVIDSYHFDNVARYVERGGAMMIASGPEVYGPLSLSHRRNLSFILPARPAGSAIEAPFRTKISEIGARHPVTADLPDTDIWGRWLRIMPVLKTSGQTLLEGPESEPILILDRVGEGRVGLFLSDHVWLWARGFDGGGPHAELLRRTAHWLMKEVELEEEALSIITADDSLIIEQRSIKDEAPSAEIEFPDGTKAPVVLTQTAPGVYRAELANPAPGYYRVTSGDLFALAIVGSGDVAEFRDVVSTAQSLTPAQQPTGGGIFFVRRGQSAATPSITKVSGGDGQTNLAGDNWAGVHARNAFQVTAIRDDALLGPSIWLITLLLALMAGWAIEGGKLQLRAR